MKAKVTKEQAKQIKRGITSYIEIRNKIKMYEKYLKNARLNGDLTGIEILEDKVRLLKLVINCGEKRQIEVMKKYAGEYDKKYPGDFD